MWTSGRMSLYCEASFQFWLLHSRRRMESLVSINPGGRVSYIKVTWRNAILLAKGCKSQILDSLRVFRTVSTIWQNSTISKLKKNNNTKQKRRNKPSEKLDRTTLGLRKNHKSNNTCLPCKITIQFLLDFLFHVFTLWMRSILGGEKLPKMCLI